MMRKLFAISFLTITTGAGFAVRAKEMPEVYGKVVKEFRYASQNSQYNYLKTNSILDVDNSESRIGVRHRYDLDQFSVGGVIELGTNSSTTNDSTGLVRIRLANFDIDGDYGKLVMGKEWTATGHIYEWVDPLSVTGVDVKGDDQAKDVKNVSSSIGLWSRTRKNLLGYSTPNFHGFKYTATFDRDDNQSRDVKGAEYWESLLSYEGELNEVKLKAYVGYIKELGTYLGGTYALPSTTRYSKDDSLLLSLNATYLDFTAGAYYQNRDRTQVVNVGTRGIAPQDKWTSIFLKYKFGSNFVAATYGNHSIDTNAAGTDADKSSDTQYALGFNHAFNDHFEAYVTAANLRHKEDNATNETNKGNKANLLSFGGLFKF